MESREISFGEEKVRPDVRTLGELSSVLLEQDSVMGIERNPAYFMYRNLAKNKADWERITNAGLRYDITIIPPGRLGIEHVKTLGHFHPNAPNSDLAYPELYQVMSGRGHYLMQKMGPEGGVDDAVIVEARQGEIVLIPPGYGHVTINPMKLELRMANWVCRNFKSDYEVFKANQGAAYYETVENEWIANERYHQPAPLRRRRPFEPSVIELSEGEDMYDLVKKTGSLDFLCNPKKHEMMFLGLP